MLAETLRSIGSEFPATVGESTSPVQIGRIDFQLSVIRERIPPPATIVDLGAGMGLFPVAAVKSGYTFYAVDDYKDPINFVVGDAAVNVLRRHGVNIVEQSVFDPLPFADGSIDVICSFHSIEHWHQSPKSLFAQCANLLRSGGVFFLGGPNCVNLRKRISVPLGRGKWSQMKDWYEQDRFRGHVREPDIDDLRYIARDMGLVNVKVYGRNYLGMESNAYGKLAKVVDPILRGFPGLCSDIFIAGSKP